jgi:hypothetical protein
MIDDEWWPITHWMRASAVTHMARIIIHGRSVRVHRGGNRDAHYRAYYVTPDYTDPPIVYCSTLLELRAALLAFAYPEGNHEDTHHHDE